MTGINRRKFFGALAGTAAAVAVVKPAKTRTLRKRATTPRPMTEGYEEVLLAGGPEDGAIASVMPGVHTLRVPVRNPFYVDWSEDLAHMEMPQPVFASVDYTDRGRMNAGRRVLEA